MTQVKETNPIFKQPRKPRSKKPADYQTVHDSAMTLDLKDQAALCKALKESVNTKTAAIQASAKAAEEVAGSI